MEWGEKSPHIFMGLFSSKKTYVSSTIYNMAGDIADRSNFLKTVIAAHVIGEDSGSMSNSIQQSYIKGPGVKLRNFGAWADDNYSIVGVPQGNLYSRISVPSEEVAKHIPHPENTTVEVQRVDVRLSEYGFWAEQYMLLNYPEQITTNWVSDYDEVNNKIKITLADTSVIEFTPNDFNKSAAYIYALYTLVTGRQADDVVEGNEVILGSAEPYPSTSGYESKSSLTREESEILEKIVQSTTTYSDGRPAEVKTTTSNSEATYTYYRAEYEKSEYLGSENESGDQLASKVTILRFRRDGSVIQTESTQTTTETLADGVVKTTVTKTTEDELVVEKAYRSDTQRVVIQSRSPAQLYIYKLGSGNQELDDLVNQKPDDGYYFPFIPVRLDNKFLSPTYEEAAYLKAKRAYKKATTGNLDDIVDDLAENKSIKDIDYAYVMFGVSLNTKENTGKKYLYKFFDRLRLSQDTNRDDYAIWRAQQTDYDTAAEEYIDWRESQNNPESTKFGTEPPSVPNTSALPVSEIRIRGNGTLNTNLDMQITWQSITRATGTGQFRVGAKKESYEVQYISTQVYSMPNFSNGTVLPTDGLRVPRLIMYHQIDDDHWESLTIIGLVHKNYIYKGKYVETDAEDAMKDAEESGFLVPLHYGVFRELSLVDATQLSTACCYLVLNSYLVKKTGFFQSGFFKILLVIAVIAITVATGGAGAALGAGLLGSAASVGAAIGLTGTLAIIAGAVANAIVAMIVTKLITAGAVAIFGEKLGAIIGTIAAIVTMQVGTAMSTGSSLASMLPSLARADNILRMTMAAGDGISGYIAAGAAETAGKTQQLIADYEKQAADISKLYEQNIGYGSANLNPQLIQAVKELRVEGSDSFLQRTLMTGSEVAELSIGLITNFTDVTLSTDLKL